jgi:PAS domain S-box-containing protein
MGRKKAKASAGQKLKGTVQGLAESVPDPLIACHPEGIVYFANREAERFFGYGSEELNGRPVSELIHKSSREVYAAAIPTDAEPPALQPPLTLRVLRKDGSAVSASLHMQQVTTHRGHLITHVFKAAPGGQVPEEALRESEARYRTMIEHAPDAIVILDLDQLRFIECNQQALKFFGLSREELLSVGPVETSPPRMLDGRPASEVGRDMIARLDAAGGQVTFEWVHLHSNGHEIPCEVRLVRFPSKDRALARGSLVDITERKEAQARLKAAQEELETRVEERTAELRRLVDSMAGREVRMAELKEVIRKLRAQLQEAGLEPVTDDPLCGNSVEDAT